MASSDELAKLSDQVLVETLAWIGDEGSIDTEPYRLRLSQQAVDVLVAMRQRILETGQGGGLVLHPDIRAELIRLGELEPRPGPAAGIPWYFRLLPPGRR